MKLARTSGTLGLVARAVMIAPLALSIAPLAQADDSGWYVGANVGRSKAKIDDERINGALLGNGFTSSSIVDDNSSTGFKAYTGYQFNRNFAIEGGYFDLGKFGYTATTVPAGTLRGDIRLKGVNLDLVGLLPLSERLSLLGRVGVNYAQARDQFAGTGAVNVLDPSPSKRQANAKFGIGMQYAFTDALALRLEAERHRVNDAVGNRGDVDLYSVGLVYHFGEKAQTPAAPTVMPEPVAVVVPPQPVEAAPPPPPRAPNRVSLSADSLFAFNKSTVTPDGKAVLAKLVADLKGTDYETIRVIGHTDRIGSHAYNMKLSTRRAEAVKAELSRNDAIPAAKISAEGVDGADPVTKPGECVGTKPTKKLIACLQPDRRVDVEVSGTK